MPNFDIHSLQRWFLKEKRDLPWRVDPNPYAVWISEVMLQQTQVAVVIPYFERWMHRFPCIRTLAEASLDEVIKCWEGLGYYSRARNLHEGARYVLDHFDGQLPSDQKLLQQIKGLGPYTIGAIRSFAFHQKTAALDGNVIRVLSRYFMIQDDICKSETVKKLRTIAEEILPENDSWIINEGLIELGALICGRKPQCSECPLKASCLSYAHGLTQQIPYKSAKAKTEFLYRSVAVITNQNTLLLKRGEKGKVMSDLHEFPYFETGKSGISIQEVIDLIQKELNLKVTVVKELPEINHSFTRYQVRLNPILLTCHEPIQVENLAWRTLSEVQKLAFSSGHRRILQQVMTNAEGGLKPE